jgi:MATE family multidrug resistance protein
VDSVTVITTSIMRALGHQKIGACISIVGYTIVAIPLGLYMCFYLHLAMNGLWIGVASGLTIVCICGGFWLLCADWKKIAMEVRDREDIDSKNDGELAGLLDNTYPDIEF